MAPAVNVLFITADQWRGDCLGAAAHPVVRTPNLDRLAAGGRVVPPPLRAGRALRAEPGVALHRHVPDEPPVGPQRHAARRPPRQRRARRPPARLRAGAVRLHRHQHRPPHRRARRPPPAPVRRRAPGLRSRCATSPRARPRRGSTGCATTASTSPTSGARSSTSPRRAPAGARSTRPKHSQTAFLTDRFLEWADEPRGGDAAVVRARLVPAAAPAVPRARAVRHDVRPDVGAGARARRDRAPRKARSIRCSA